MRGSNGDWSGYVSLQYRSSITSLPSQPLRRMTSSRSARFSTPRPGPDYWRSGTAGSVTAAAGQEGGSADYSPSPEVSSLPGSNRSGSRAHPQ